MSQPILNTTPRHPVLANTHAKAQAYFSEHGLPDRKAEHWKYTPLKQLWHQQSLPLLTPQQAPEVTRHFDGYHVILHHGELIHCDTLPQGVSITDWSNATAEQLTSYAEPEIDFDRHRLAALTLSHMQNGLIIEVSTQTTLDKPIVIIHSAQDEGAAHYHHHITLGEHAQACVIEMSHSPQQAVQTILTSTTLAAQSHYQHYVIETPTSQGQYISGLHLSQQDNSTCFYYCHAGHNHLARYDVHAHLHGEGANCTTNGTYDLNAKQHSDHHILIEHHASHTTSTQFYKGLAQDKARAVFNGKAIIHANTREAAAHQHNHNLLLSRQAEIDTKPELEIYSDAVNCTHGVTVGQLDEQQLFYLQSRGIDPIMAEQLLTQAFTAEVEATIDNTQIATYLNHAAPTDHE